MWTYEMYGKNDTSSALKNQARASFGFAGKDAYFLLNDGTVRMVQWEGQAPDEYQGATLEETAANHCAALNNPPDPEPSEAPDPAQMEAALNELGVQTRA